MLQQAKLLLLTFNMLYVFCTHRQRKALESQSIVVEERSEFMEKQLKEAKVIAEDTDSKYDEVTS